MKISQLPEDMRQLLADYSHDCGWLEEGDWERFETLDLPFLDIPAGAFRVPSGGFRWTEKELTETDLRDLPPVVVAHGMLVDGVHRVRAAGVQGFQTVGALDAGRVLPRECVEEFGIGPLCISPTMVRETGATRDSLENARLLLAAYGPPDRIIAMEEGDEWVVEAHWRQGVDHRFEGFSWGYKGEGPHGLEGFFKMIEMDPPVTIAEIARWPQPRRILERRERGRMGPKEWAPAGGFRRRFLKGADYWKGWA